MKILYVITSLGIGGAETQVCSLVDKMVERGHEVTIVYLSGAKVVSPRSDKVNVFGLGLTGAPMSLINTFIKLIKVCKSIEPDVVHSHMFHANILSRIIRFFTKIPVLISTAHSSNEGGYLRTLAYRYTNKLTDLTTNVSDVSVKRYLEIGAASEGSIISMFNGIDVERFSPKPNKNFRTELGLKAEDKLIVSIGRNAIEKDYPNLLYAISKINDHQARFVIIGKGSSDLAGVADSLGIKDRVKFIGIRTDIPDILNSADLLVMSSKIEGLPIVIGEAMASSCNIVTTNAGGCSEWLTINEVPVKIQNSDALALAISNKLSQSEMNWLEISKQNRQHIIDNFSIEIVADKWIEIYEDPKSVSVI